jgi:hypothetical protein
LIFFRRFNFSGDRLIQFIERPMRYWFPAHAGFLAVADQNPSFTGCPTFTRQLTKLMRKKKNLSIISAGQLPPFHCDDPRPMGFPALANVTGLCAAAVPAFYKFNVVGIVDMLGDLPEVGRFHADAYRVLTLERHPDSTQRNPIQAVIGQFIDADGRCHMIGKIASSGGRLPMVSRDLEQVADRRLIFGN